MACPARRPGQAGRLDPLGQRRDPLRPDQPPGAASEEELREAVIKHIHSEAKLYPGRGQTGTATRFVLGCAKPLTSGQAAVVNVAVNENPAESCLWVVSEAVIVFFLVLTISGMGD